MTTESEEHRIAPRRRQLKGATIAFNARHSTLPCTITSLSETGARLKVTSSIDAPDTFELIVELDGFSVECLVVWRREEEIGVRFVGPRVSEARTRTQTLKPTVKQSKPSLRRKPLRVE